MELLHEIQATLEPGSSCKHASNFYYAGYRGCENLLSKRGWGPLWVKSRSQSLVEGPQGLLCRERPSESGSQPPLKAGLHVKIGEIEPAIDLQQSLGRNPLPGRQLYMHTPLFLKTVQRLFLLLYKSHMFSKYDIGVAALREHNS